MAEPERRRNVLFYLATEGVIPVVGGCAGALAGGPSAGIAGVAVGHVVEKAINLFGRGIVERWRGWFAHNPAAAGAAVAELAALPPDQARAEAKSLLLDLAPDAAPPDLALAVEFLSAIPRAVDRALVPDPAGGRSVPPTVAFDDPRSLLQLLPEDVPPYPPTAALPDTPYQLVELLGAGGFGAVYRAVSPTLQHLPFAIKFCLDRSLLPALNQERSNLERLMRAGGRGAAHVVRLYGYDLDHPTPYLVYEYVEGGDLTKLIAARRAAHGRAPDPAEVLGWIVQIADGLAFAHRTGLVHRDLKPANILVSSTPQEFHPPGATGTTPEGPERGAATVELRLADFGLGGVAVARAAARSRIGTTTLDFLSLADQASLFRGAGTPLYMSPEQRRGAPPDPRHDLYALGVVWYQLLTGDVSRELHHGWAKELVVRHGVPAGHIALIERCVGWFDERPKDAGELLPLLKEAAGQPVPPASPGAAGPLPPASSAATDTVAGASQITPVPKAAPVSESGRRRGAVATLAQLDGVYSELDDMTKWRFETTAGNGVLLALFVGGTIGLIAATTGKLEAGWLGIPVGLLTWGVYVYLIRAGVKAVTEDIQKRADGLVSELTGGYPLEVAEWGGRAALRHPATVRRLRRGFVPPSPATTLPASGLTPADLAASPTHRALLVARLRALDHVLRTSEENVGGSWFGLVSLWLVGVPLVVGGTLAILHGPPPDERLSEVRIANVAGAAGVLAAGLSWLGMAVVRRYARRKASEAVDRVAADYPHLVAEWGGRGTVENRETIAALVRTLDPSGGAAKRGGFFRRLLGR